MKLATKYAPCLRGQGDDVGIIIFEKIIFFGRMTRQGIEPATSRTRVRNDTSKPSPLGSGKKRATKLIRVCKDLSYKDRLLFLQLPTLKYRRFRGDMIEVYKILNGFYDAKVVPPLERNLDCRTRGNSFKLKVDRCKHDIRKFSFCNRVVNVWNSLPDYVVTSGSLNIFKNNLDKHWKCEFFYYDFEADPPGFV